MRFTFKYRVVPISIIGFPPVRFDVSWSDERRIHKLCQDLLASSSDADRERLINELRAALREHIEMARSSLADQASTIAFLDANIEKRSA